MKQLRGDFFSDDNQMRRNELGDEFSALKSRLMEDFMSARPSYFAREDQELSNGFSGGPDRGATLLDGEANVRDRLRRQSEETERQQPRWSDLGGAAGCEEEDGRDNIGLSPGSAGSSIGPAQPLSSGSLANLYDKIKALKGEFQSVEQRMRSAVEALPVEKRFDNVSVQSSRATDSDYGSEINSRVSSPVNPFASPSPTSHVFSGSCPPSRGVTSVQNLRPSCSPSSSISSFSYPHARSPSPSLSDYNSESTLRPSSPCRRGKSRLDHSETYVQIPVVVKGGLERIEVGRQPLPSWEISWEWGGEGGRRHQESWGYSATVFTYRDV